jgi:hypothetical protein
LFYTGTLFYTAEVKQVYRYEAKEMTEDQVMEGLERQDRELGLCPESMEGCSIFCFLFYRCGLISSLIIFMFAFYSVFSDIFPISFGTGGF